MFIIIDCTEGEKKEYSAKAQKLARILHKTNLMF